MSLLYFPAYMKFVQALQTVSLGCYTVALLILLLRACGDSLRDRYTEQNLPCLTEEVSVQTPAVLCTLACEFTLTGKGGIHTLKWWQW